MALPIRFILWLVTLPFRFRLSPLDFSLIWDLFEPEYFAKCVINRSVTVECPNTDRFNWLLDLDARFIEILNSSVTQQWRAEAVDSKGFSSFKGQTINDFEEAKGPRLLIHQLRRQ